MGSDPILTIMKVDLGISVTTLDDDALKPMIALATKHLERQGMTFTGPPAAEDGTLIGLVAAWMWRKRKDNVPMSAMLQRMIHDRLLSEKLAVAEPETAGGDD